MEFTRTSCHKSVKVITLTVHLINSEMNCSYTNRCCAGENVHKYEREQLRFRTAPVWLRVAVAVSGTGCKGSDKEKRSQPAAWEIL
jgi:hypothetical protein